jgi:hypothetical protein
LTAATPAASTYRFRTRRRIASQPATRAPSLQERYGNASGTNDNYVAAVTAAANALVSQRFLLPEGIATYVTPATLMVIPANP